MTVSSHHLSKEYPMIKALGIFRHTERQHSPNFPKIRLFTPTLPSSDCCMQNTSGKSLFLCTLWGMLILNAKKYSQLLFSLSSICISFLFEDTCSKLHHCVKYSKLMALHSVQTLRWFGLTRLCLHSLVP